MRRGPVLLRAVGHVRRLMANKDLGLIAAGVAFYSILSIFPGIAATIALWGLIGDPARALEEVARYKALLPADVYALIEAQLLQLVDADGLTLGWASILSFGLAIWTARAGVAALIRGLNAIYEVPNRGGFWHAVQALFLTLCLIVVAVVALGSVVIAPVVLSFVDLGPWTAWGLALLRWTIALVVLLAAFALVYRIGPNVAAREHGFLTAGGVIAAVGWAIASAGFSVYLANFGNYNEVYGSIGAVIAMLMWLYISAWLVLLGGALNAALNTSRER